MSANSKPTRQAEDHHHYLLKSKSKKERQGRAIRAYKWFLELPVPLVLGVMWLAGVGLMGVGVLVLYLFWLALKGVAGG
jgi:hypothetical protein